MTLRGVIIRAQKTTHKIKMGRWLSGCVCYVENGYIRQEHNKTQTGKPHIFNIDELLSNDWKVVK